MAEDPSAILSHLRLHQERSLPSGDKQQGLSFEEIVSRTADFLLEQRSYFVTMAFSNEVGADLEDVDDLRFDPVALYARDKDRLPLIQAHVENDVELNEANLFERKGESIYAYNTLVFGAAIKLARDEPLSHEWREFLVEHLIDPRPPTQRRRRGRPKMSTEEKLLRVYAVKFAAAHGLSPTRNEETAEEVSACDAVAKAAQRLHAAHGIEDFALGYSYESLRKLWWALA